MQHQVEAISFILLEKRNGINWLVVNRELLKTAQHFQDNLFPIYGNQKLGVLVFLLSRNSSEKILFLGGTAVVKLDWLVRNTLSKLHCHLVKVFPIVIQVTLQ